MKLRSVIGVNKVQDNFGFPDFFMNTNILHLNIDLTAAIKDNLLIIHTGRIVPRN